MLYIVIIHESSRDVNYVYKSRLDFTTKYL